MRREPAPPLVPQVDGDSEKRDATPFKGEAQAER